MICRIVDVLQCTDLGLRRHEVILWGVRSINKVIPISDPAVLASIDDVAVAHGQVYGDSHFAGEHGNQAPPEPTRQGRWSQISQIHH